MLSAFVFSVFTLIFYTQAQSPQQALQSLEVKKGDRLIVEGFRGQVKLEPNTENSQLRVMLKNAAVGGEEWTARVFREQNELRVKVNGPSSKQDWGPFLAGNTAPEIQLQLQLPPNLAVEVHLLDGQIQAQDLKQDILANLKKGQVSIKNTSGKIKLFVLEGKIDLQAIQGEVKIDTYSARVNLSQIQAQVQLDNFTGETSIQKLEGELQFKTHSGVSTLQEMKGQLTFDNGSSPLKIDRFEGQMAGQSAQGSVLAKVLGNSRVRLNSHDGQVALELPGSGAYVNLGTQEGRILAPNYLRQTQLPNLKIMSGRLRGETGGRIYVRTEKGVIRLK